MVAPDFKIVMTVCCQTINDIGVEIMIPEFRIAMMVCSQVITVIDRIEKEYSMVDLMTIIILSAVPPTITILRGSLMVSPQLVVSQCWTT